jgi:hypothetical protein
LVKGRDQKDHLIIKETDWKIEPSHLTHHAPGKQQSICERASLTLNKGWWRGMDFFGICLVYRYEKKNIEIYPPFAKKGQDSESIYTSFFCVI